MGCCFGKLRSGGSSYDVDGEVIHAKPTAKRYTLLFEFYTIVIYILSIHFKFSVCSL